MDVQVKTMLPTRAELKILQVLWEIGNGTVEDTSATGAGAVMTLIDFENPI